MGRFMLDCGWWRHPHFRGLSAEALHVWQAGVSFCMDAATDGMLGVADVEELAAALGVKASWVRKATKELTARGLWREVQGPYGTELETVGYADHNPTKTEIDAYTEERSELGRKGNHVRWHVNEDRVDPRCPYCTGELDCDTPNTDRSSDGSTDPPTIANASHGMGWDGIPPNPPSPTDRSRIDPTVVDTGMANIAHLRGAS
jgi:hypothetical protein